MKIFNHNDVRSIMDFFTVFEVAQASLLVFILLVMKKNRRANIFFALFMTILSVNLFSMFLHGNGFRDASSVLMMISLPGISIAGVLIYFYTSVMTGVMESFRRRDMLHFIIYFILLAIFFTLWYLLRDREDHGYYLKNFSLIFLGLGLANSLGYVVFSMMKLKNYLSKIENYFSDIEKYDMKWLKKLTTLSFVYIAGWNMEYWLFYFGITDRNPLWFFINICMLTIIIFTMTFYIVNKPETLKETREMMDELDAEEEISEKEKYAKQSIDDIMKKDYLKRIREFMDSSRPHLNENVTIKEIAADMNIPSHHLSIVINDMLNMNFYTFINEYRIKEAIKILEDPSNAEASILSIAYSSGFNSKSTFNTVFKKNTGKTPSEYRNSLPARSGLAS